MRWGDRRYMWTDLVGQRSLCLHGDGQAATQLPDGSHAQQRALRQLRLHVLPMLLLQKNNN